MTYTDEFADPTPAPRAKGKGGRIAAGVIGGLVLLAGGAYGVGYALAGQTLPPDTTIQGVPVGGLSTADAEDKLTTELADKAAAPLTLAWGEHQLTRTPQEAGLAVDVPASVAQADPGKPVNPLEIWAALTGGSAHEAVLTRDDAKLDVLATEFAQLVNAAPTNAELAIEEGQPALKEGVNGREVDAEATKEVVAQAYLESTEIEPVVAEPEPDVTTAEAQQTLDDVVTPALSAPITVQAGEQSFEVTPEMIAASFVFEPADGTIKASINPDALMEHADPALDGLGLEEPKDASYTFADGKPTVVPSVTGKGVARDELAQAVSDSMLKSGEERSASVTVTEKEPELTTEKAQQLGVKEIIGEFTTSFPASQYRITNIGKSSRMMNGVFLKPGDVFSMNKTLGRRTLANGWASGGAIDGGRVVERMGGGISQTTTTAFNAAFFAGLEIITHRPHSLYFSRYPMGREATLDYDTIDLQFRNNTEYGVLLQAFTNNPSPGGQGTVTVRVWSTKVYDVKATNPVQSNHRSPGKAIKDNSAVCSPQGAMNGFTVNYSRQFFKNGSLVKTEPFRWTYDTLTPVECTNPNARPDRKVG